MPENLNSVFSYLSSLGIFLQFVQLGIAGLQEAFENGMIVLTALLPDQLHTLTELLNVQQNVLQRDWENTLIQ